MIFEILKTVGTKEYEAMPVCRLSKYHAFQLRVLRTASTSAYNGKTFLFQTPFLKTARSLLGIRR